MISVTTPAHPAQPGGSAAQATESGPRPARGAAIPSATLLGDRETVAIEHRGVIYVLRATRAGKLILTK